MPQKVWKIRTEAAKDARGCERTFKAVSRASDTDQVGLPDKNLVQEIKSLINRSKVWSIDQKMDQQIKSLINISKV